MSKKANPAVIGGFVVGAIVLLVTAVALFGGKELFVARDQYVAYFQERTKGLRVGANVLMNGVRIGYVSEIALQVDTQSLSTLTRVKLELLPDTYIQTIEGVPVGEGMGVGIGHDWLISKAGLRAQLDIESFVTGQLFVELEFRPDTDMVLRGVNAGYPEIPTITSNLQQMLDNLERWMSDVQSDLDIGEISTRLVSALQGLDELAHSSDLRDSLAGLNALLNDEATQNLAVSIDAVVADFRETLGEASELFRSADRDLDVLISEITPALRSLNAALVEADRVLTAAGAQLDGDSPQIYQLQSTLRELEGASIAIREFFDYLERNPEALIRGKKQ
jgi:paraquat-inducible protein B